MGRQVKQRRLMQNRKNPIMQTAIGLSNESNASIEKLNKVIKGFNASYSVLIIPKEHGLLLLSLN
jgi:hypothetical protein